jgi:hypothetical protein
MKRLILLFFAALMIAGCGEKPQTGSIKINPDYSPSGKRHSGFNERL